MAEVLPKRCGCGPLSTLMPCTGSRLVDYADLWTASKRTFGAFVASRQMAETPQEWFEAISARLAS